MKTLNEIGLETKTDKAAGIDNGHGYLDFYETFLSQYRDKATTIIEIGIGGYHLPTEGGQSLRMWDQYFTHPDTQIVGVDIYPKHLQGIGPRVKAVLASQTGYDDLVDLVDKTGSPDIIIDDASHVNSLSIATFDIMFGLLRPGGVYIWEDIHTSFWPDYGGTPERYAPGTAMHFLAGLAYGLQADTIPAEHRGKWDGHIQSMHFMRNTCVIIKRKQQ